ncbi:MAG: hypothetical protein M1281_15160 [Chloroflexi bacterium]|nr:hypothetical protein [Chloroflexota bacterium]
MDTHLLQEQSERLKRQREATKRTILRDRTFLGQPYCPVCMQPLGNQGELHEVILTRGDVRGCPEEVRLSIHAPINCVIVHPGPCHLKAQHELEGKLACLSQIAFFEGFEPMIYWLNAVEHSARGGSALEKQYFLLRYREEIETYTGLYVLVLKQRELFANSLIPRGGVTHKDGAGQTVRKSC